MKKWWSLGLLAIIIVISSCTKKEGEGGTASISGTVNMKLVSDDFQTTYANFPALSQDVYIVYGDDDFYSDKTETHYDGTYHFGYLRKGNYRVYTYSDDSTGQSTSGKVVVERDVAIKKNGKKVTVEDMLVLDKVTNYEGSNSISGRLFAYDYNSEMTILKDSFYVRNEYVYIARKLDNYYFDRIRTYHDGSFVFQLLPQGEYEIFAYSRDPEMLDPQDEIPVIINVNIEENNQAVNVGRLDIID
ncbi:MULTISPECIES: hypothetical protein [unclassified Lentimicrobium]|uniref:hypothetical protein n=1 Tax=unclassified Lentimicrobium TaxID=2677434 RepID=UPI0015580CF1|nr:MULTISPECIES: hypothetical protein [unclassified Lentimicrobium]NPD46859.1 hypothetical protein [Lentimicrobium sp. S6]NPD84442.1 hypothetical protein [Lentimicrobium sp. L6]